MGTVTIPAYTFEVPDGAPGPQGPAGPMGPQGVPGPAGPTPTLASLGLYAWADGTVHTVPQAAPPVAYRDFAYTGSGSDLLSFLGNLPSGTEAQPTRALLPVGLRATVPSRLVLNGKSWLEVWGIDPAGGGGMARITSSHPGDKIEGSLFAIGNDAPCHHVRLVGLALVGSNAQSGTPGAYVAGRESQHGVSVWTKGASHHITVTDCVISRMTGHAVYVRGTAEDVELLDNVITGMGVMGIAVAQGKRITLRGNSIRDTALYPVDIEDGAAGQVVEDLVVEGNVIDRWSLTSVDAYGRGRMAFACFLSVGMSMARWRIAGNTFRGGRVNTAASPYGSTIHVGGTDPKADVVVRDNVFESSVSAPDIQLEKVTGGRVAGNGAAVVRLVGCTGVVQA